MPEHVPTSEITSTRIAGTEELKNIGFVAFWGVLGGALGGLTLDAVRNGAVNSQHDSVTDAIEYAEAQAGTTRDSINTLEEEFPAVPEAIAAAETRLGEKESGIQALQAQREALPPDMTTEYVGAGAVFGFLIAGSVAGVVAVIKRGSAIKRGE